MEFYFYTCMGYEGNQYPFPLYEDSSASGKFILKFNCDFIAHHPATRITSSFDDTLKRIFINNSGRFKRSKYAILRCSFIDSPNSKEKIVEMLMDGIGGYNSNFEGFDIHVNNVFDFNPNMPKDLKCLP